VQHDGRDNGIARSLWPFGFALAAAAFLVGLVISWWLVAIGGGAALVIGGLWIVDSIRRRHPHLLEETDEDVADEPAPAVAPRAAAAGPAITRSRFLEAGTLGLGAVMGGALTVPAVGFMIAPAFSKQRDGDSDLGPVENFPEGTYMVSTFMLDKRDGDVSRRTAFIRYNGELKGQPSFTIVTNRCAHLGCPVQPSGPMEDENAKEYETTNGLVRLVPSNPAGFICPCHGGSYDAEGNVTGGPPVRALDRYEYSILGGNLFIGKPYSVGTVTGEGKDARIRKFDLAAPGQPVDGWQWWLYPAQPPH
jgi:menaquinol-cytochrome c reductase iron-sulfur subunit